MTREYNAPGLTERSRPQYARRRQIEWGGLREGGSVFGGAQRSGVCWTAGSPDHASPLAGILISGPYAAGMFKPALLPLALTLPLLASCAPLASLLANSSSDGPSPRRAGPLVVGQTWTVSGLVDGRSVSATVSIPNLVDVQDTSATFNARDQLDAFAASRVGFTVADYDGGRRVARFRWVGESAGLSYTCRIENVISAPLRGVLTYERGGQTVARGTCEAVISQNAG